MKVPFQEILLFWVPSPSSDTVTDALCFQSLQSVKWQTAKDTTRFWVFSLWSIKRYDHILSKHYVLSLDLRETKVDWPSYWPKEAEDNTDTFSTRLSSRLLKCIPASFPLHYYYVIGKNEVVVSVNEDGTMKVLLEGLVHNALEYGWSTGQPIQHHPVLVVASICYEGSLPCSDEVVGTAGQVWWTPLPLVEFPGLQGRRVAVLDSDAIMSRLHFFAMKNKPKVAENVDGQI